MRHKFTVDECRRGGKKSASLKAIYRRANPTRYEARVRKAVALLPLGNIEFEYPVSTAINLTQYMDIYFQYCNKFFALEIDGSHSWHYSGKMEMYDELKARWCNEHGILLIYVTAREINKMTLQEIADLVKSKLLTKLSS